MQRCFCIASAMALAMCSATFADLLVNEQFANPTGFPPCGGVGGNGDPPASDWTMTGNAHWNRNTGFNGPADCATEIDDGYYASFWWGYMNVNESTVTQNKSGLTVGEYYKLSFKWSNDVNMADPVVGGTFSVEVRDGLSNTSGSPKASISEDVIASAHAFETKSFVFQATSSDITVCWRVKLKTSAGHTNTYAFFLISHMDFIKLEVAACTTPPTIDSTTPTTPEYGVRGQSPPITIHGTNFVTGTTAQLIKGATIINGTGVSVAPDGTSLTATFPIPIGAPVGPYTVKVARPEAYCDPATASASFEVVLPGLSNASFNGDASITACTPGTLDPNLPKDWQASEAGTWGYGNRLNLNGYRDGTALATLPTCPVPGGDSYYGTIASASNASGAYGQAWQTFAVTPGSTYVVSGQFAGSGDCTVTLRLLDGLKNSGTELVSKVIRSAPGSYDWTTGFVAATAPVGGTGVITFIWDVARNSGADNASHADSLVLEECTAPITVTGVSTTPAQSTNRAADNPTTLTIDGTGFTGTPLVWLAKGSTLLPANVTAVSSGQITADIDLTGAETGRYTVIVKQGACIDSYGPPDAGEAGVLVVGDFVNGDFELPTAPVDHGTCTTGDPPNSPPQTVLGLPTGWSSDAPSGLVRDGASPLPPNNGGVPECIPSNNGGHYGSMSYGSAGTLRAWQTVDVAPGTMYEFSGEFNAGPEVVVTLRILSGDETGTELASSPVTLVANEWVPGAVQAIAPSSGVMTVVWEMVVSGTAPNVGGHADGFQLASRCNSPFADADGDGDVDQADFAIFQVCFTGSTGPIPATPAYCECFDRPEGDPPLPDLDIDQSDLARFEACASGPGIPAIPTCGE
jgi:hypothetical protein